MFLFLLRRFALSLLLLAAGATAVTLLAPGGLGTTRKMVVTNGPSAAAYRVVAPLFQGVLDGKASLLALLGLLSLAGLVAWTAWRTSWIDALLVTVAAVAAYGMSEAVKLVVDEERPCRVFTEFAVDCPPSGDLSFPSNHATVAGAIAAGLIVVAPRLGAVAVPLALFVALMRVVGGVHYPHDVLAGLLLGAATAGALLLSAQPVAFRIAGARPVRRALRPPRGSARPGGSAPR
jgi:membrane-associated phospholipid phosphatase